MLGVTVLLQSCGFLFYMRTQLLNQTITAISLHLLPTPPHRILYLLPKSFNQLPVRIHQIPVQLQSRRRWLAEFRVTAGQPLRGTHLPTAKPL